MKKFLSLVLALVMAMSLVTVSAGAKDFTDSEKLSGDVYVEAVDVMSTMGIIDGYADGSFQPQGTLTRGAAAKIIACMMLGKTTAEALGTQAAPFKDVPVGSTFAGYIAYCVESGIIDGYADGTFRPSNTLTGFAFLKMLLTALGYDSTVEGYTGTNWTVNVAGRAQQIGLTDGNDNFVGTKAATREEACLYAVNTLKATLVEYETKGTSITINGATISQAASNATYVTSNVYSAATSIDNTKDNATGDYTVEFAEKYQPNLKLVGDIDAFGRPAHTWSWKNEEIGQYIDYDLLLQEYTEKVTGKELYNLLGKNVIDEYHFLVSVDGETDDAVLGSAYFDETYMTKAYDSGVGETGDGVLTQVFVDSANEQVYIAVINTYLAIADGDYDAKKETAKFDVYSLTHVGDSLVKFVADGDHQETLTASSEDFAVEEIEDGDVVLVNVADGAIQVISDVEVLEDVTITAFSKGKSVTSGGTKYGYADTAEYDPEVLDHYTNAAGQNLKDLTYNIYLDQYGYLIGVDLVEVPNNYVFLTGLDAGTSNLSAKTADATVIFIDGTVKTVEVNMEKSEDDAGNDLTGGALLNTWCTYTVDKNEVYTLTEVDTAVNTNPMTGGVEVAQYRSSTAGAANGGVEIDSKHVSLDGHAGGGADNAYSKVYGNDASIYLNVGLKVFTSTTEGAPVAAITKVNGVTTGVKNANLKAMNNQDVFDKYNTDLGASANNAGRISSGVYTLYKDNGYVIAAVVVGENAVASENLAYVNSDDVEWESYSADDGEWTWSRTVIINGVETEIKYKGDALDLIGEDDMDEGEWYEVRFDADGYVLDYEAANTAMGADYVTAIANVPGRINTAGVDTVLYTQTFNNDSITMKGSTLYATTTNSTGFFVAEDVKAVLIQENNAKTTTTFEEGVDNLEDLIDELHPISSVNSNNNYTISAILEDGAAVVVIIEDHVNDGANPQPPQDEVGSDTYEASLALVGGNVQLTVATQANSDVTTAFTYSVKITNTTSGFSYTTDGDGVLATGNNTAPSTATVNVATAGSGSIYQVTVVIGGDTLVTNTISG